MPTRRLSPGPFRLPRSRAGRQAFTLVEVMIVVTALAIIAGAVIPQVQTALDDAQNSAALADLAQLTTAIERYRIEHSGDAPDDFTGRSLPQLTDRTDSLGNIGEGPGFTYGPYLPDGIPANAINGVAQVFLTNASPPTNLDRRVGWVYHPDTGQIWAGMSRERPKLGSGGNLGGGSLTPDEK